MCTVHVIHDCIHSPFWNKGGPSDLFDDNNVDWAPSLNLGHETSLNVSDTEARYERAMRRNTVKKQEDQECNSETMVEERTTDLEPQPEQDINDNEIQQTLKKLQQECAQLNQDNIALRNEKAKMQTKLQQECAQLNQDNIALRTEKEEMRPKDIVVRAELKEDFFKNDDEKVRYYTGLTNWKLLLIIYQFVQPCLNTASRSTLSAFQQLIMTLMRLHLGLSGQDLGYRFGVHRSTVSRVFSTVVCVL